MMWRAKRHQNACVWEDNNVVLIFLCVGRHQHDVTLTCMRVGRHQRKAQGGDLSNGDPPSSLF
jgi:hypothetical protein